MTTKEMIDEYNKLTGKKIKKFSSRTAGEKQLAAARVAGEKPTGVFTPSSKPGAMPRAKREPSDAPSQRRSDSARESWSSKPTAVARAKRDAVAVNGQVYRSVGHAFKELRLPMGQHIRFRGQLKAAGKMVFKYNDKQFNFAITTEKES